MQFVGNMHTLQDNILKILLEKMASIKQKISAEEYNALCQKIKSFSDFENNKADNIDNGYTLIFEKILNRLPMEQQDITQ